MLIVLCHYTLLDTRFKLLDTILYIFMAIKYILVVLLIAIGHLNPATAILLDAAFGQCSKVVISAAGCSLSPLSQKNISQLISGLVYIFNPSPSVSLLHIVKRRKKRMMTELGED